MLAPSEVGVKSRKSDEDRVVKFLCCMVRAPKSTNHSVKFVFVRQWGGKDLGALPKTSSKHTNCKNKVMLTILSLSSGCF